MNIKFRLENNNDYFKVEELAREAFWNLYKPGCDEHYLISTMRNHPDFIKELDFIAENDGEIVGSIMYTKSSVINKQNELIETATFGPLCVHPDFQRIGIGSALIEYTKERAFRNGFPAIIIFGDPHNYYKHGFRTGKDYGISTMDGKYPFGLLVLELEKGVFKNHKWKFKESSVYNVDIDKANEYDNRFPEKEKMHKYSQDLFLMMIRSFVE